MVCVYTLSTNILLRDSRNLNVLPNLIRLAVTFITTGSTKLRNYSQADFNLRINENIVNIQFDCCDVRGGLSKSSTRRGPS